MTHETRGAAKITFGNGKIMHWLYSPDIPYAPNESDTLAEVARLCLKGDIVSVDAIEVQVIVPEGSSGYQLVGTPAEVS